MGLEGTRGEIDAFDEMSKKAARLSERLRSVIVGQHEIVEQLLVATLCQGHTLIVGVPGLAKTLLVRTLAASLRLEFKRIQFTPDMMPSDIIGSEILQTDPATGERRMRFAPGPIFAQMILADEINRTPPRTQAALLEAMAERQVSVGGETRRLEAPFIVVATQNPIEQEGTYPLPEAQLDRFMLGLRMGYPKAMEERRIVAEGEAIPARAEAVAPVFDAAELNAMRRMIAQMPVSEHVVDYAVALVRATRPEDETCPGSVKGYVSWGAGPRAGQSLIAAARCLAAIEGEPTPACHHVQRMAAAALRHRLVLNYAASAEGVDADEVVARILREVSQSSYESR
ncbi:MAG: MoxR family ATPase [Planctomycetota bacterium]|nr:MoxR family ATPase [Planctomycetota bacterium]